MNKQPISLLPEEIPGIFRPLLLRAKAYDSSCSHTARVIYFDSGCYLKSAPKGTLKKEAEMNRIFHSMKLGPEVLEYVSDEKDWLLTGEVRGEDCCFSGYLEDPKRLCDTVAELLVTLHGTEIPAGCPEAFDREEYLSLAEKNCREGFYRVSGLPQDWKYPTPEKTWEVIERYGNLLTADTLIHGDYCLPNIILDDWRFSGLIDLGSSGRGDRHIDLYWGMWSLCYNLKTERYRERFLDAYGRSRVDEERLLLVTAVEAFC